MESLMDALSQIVLSHQSWSYYIIALGTILQGEITFLVAMYLIINKSLSFWGVILSAFLSVFTTDYFLYFLGGRLRNTKFGWRLYRKIKNDKKTQFYSYYISQNLRKVIILSKFLIGTNIITLVMIGWTRVKLGRFFKAHLQSIFIWLSSMVLISYFLAGGAYILKAGKIFKQAEIIILIVFVLIIFGEILLKKFINRVIGVEITTKKIGGNISLSKLKIFQKRTDDYELKNLEDLENEENKEINKVKNISEAGRIKSGNLENIFKNNEEDKKKDKENFL